MPDFSSSTLRLFQRFFTTASSHSQHAGIKTVLDGNTAVAATEACIAEAAGLRGHLSGARNELLLERPRLSWVANMGRSYRCWARTLKRERGGIGLR
ncbi:hypothetical protein BGS_0832 [Beggiatoa sp. SS]|nr:hypothetical protein BGS_0832 [Beggiatoa sp. SS]